MKTLQAYNFIWDNYIGRCGYSSAEVWDFESDKPLNGFSYVGEIDSTKLSVRPRVGRAVMLEDNDTFEQFWLHI